MRFRIANAEIRLTIVNNIYIISGPNPPELHRPQAVEQDVKPDGLKATELRRPVVVRDDAKPTCPDAWTFFNATRKCYKVVFNANLTWSQAHWECIRRRAKLASIRSDDENAFILKLASSPPFPVVDWNDGQCCAIGKCPDMNCFVGKWEDGRLYHRHASEPRDRALWASGEPWNRGGNQAENCVQVLATNTTKHMREHEVRFANKWNDYYCDRPVRSHICEKATIV